MCAAQHSGEATPKSFGFFSFQVSQELTGLQGQDLLALGGALQVFWVLFLLHVDFIVGENITVFENRIPKIPSECKLQSISS